MNRDLREYTRDTKVRLVLGFLVLVFLVGDGLIFLFFGQRAGLAGLICLVAALLPILLVALFLWLADWVVKKGRE